MRCAANTMKVAGPRTAARCLCICNEATLFNQLLAAGLTTLFAGCMTVRPDDPVYIRQQQLQARVDRLDQVLSNQSLADISQHLDALQDQLNQLRGDVQLLQHNQDLGKKQQRDLYSDLDKRLQKLELGLHSGAAPAADADSGSAIVAPTAGSSAGPATASGDQAAYQRNFNLLKQGRLRRCDQWFHQFHPAVSAKPAGTQCGILDGRGLIIR